MRTLHSDQTLYLSPGQNFPLQVLIDLQNLVPVGKNLGVLSNILRSPYHFVSHNQLQSPHHRLGCIFPWMGEKNLDKYDAPVLRTLSFSPQMLCLFK